jgi:uncharacterized protein (TIGR02996 family)
VSALALTEIELLEAVARDPDDELALSVLADYWLEHGEEARGAFLQLQCGVLGARIDLADEEVRLAEHARRWREPLLRAGYAEEDLTLVRAMLQRPLAVPAGGPLDGDPALIRISPRYYRELHEVVSAGTRLGVMVAEAVTPLGTERVALKVCEFSDYLPLMEREHAILQRLRHPNIVRSLGFASRPRGRAHVLRWAGTSLEELLHATQRHQRTLGVAFAISVARQLCDALEAVHAADIVHRRISPAHVLVAADGTVTLVDFKEARAVEPEWDPHADDPEYDRGLSGWARYLAPEQVNGAPAPDASTDVYGAMMLACELVEGVHPAGPDGDFQEIFAALRAILGGNLMLPALPRPIEAVARRALVSQQWRLGSAAELREALDQAAAASSIELGPHVIAQVLCELGVPA